MKDREKFSSLDDANAFVARIRANTTTTTTTPTTTTVPGATTSAPPTTPTTLAPAAP